MFDFTTWTNVLKDTAESAGKKAGEVLEVTKMRVQLAQQKAELSEGILAGEASMLDARTLRELLG